jgi:hypothetical protein
MRLLRVPRFVTRPLRARLEELLTEVAHETARENARAVARDIDLAALRMAAEDAAAFLSSFAPLARSYGNKRDLLDAAIDAAQPNDLCCEFGVFRGETINHIASRWKGKVHGFDSFAGLPEDWKANYRAGHFKVDALPPVLPNVVLHKGLFHETIPKFLRAWTEPLGFLHIDCDLYSSTQTIFEKLADRIVPGTVIQFDEFFNYPGWRSGEYRAFEEFRANCHVDVEYIGYVSSGEQLAIKITAIGRPEGETRQKSARVQSVPAARV